MSEPINLQELRRLATAAAAGEWTWDPETGWLTAPDPDNYDDRQIIVEACDDEVEASAHEFEFIAAANPKTVLALLDRIAELEGEVDGRLVRGRFCYLAGQLDEDTPAPAGEVFVVLAMPTEELRNLSPMLGKPVSVVPR